MLYLVEVYLNLGTLTPANRTRIERETKTLREIVAASLTPPSDRHQLTVDEVTVTCYYMATKGQDAEDDRHVLEHMELDVQVVVTAPDHDWLKRGGGLEVPRAIMAAWDKHLPPGVTAEVNLKLEEIHSARRGM